MTTAQPLARYSAMGRASLAAALPSSYTTTGDGTLAEIILDRNSEWAEVYDPARLKPGAVGSLISAAAGTVAGLAGHLGSGELSAIDDLKAGEGGIIREGLSQIAAFRDENGTLHRLSPLALMPVALCIGMPPSNVEIARATDRSSRRTAKHLTGRQ